MAVTIKQTEGAPESYPVLDPAVSDSVWQRIEAYTAHRYTTRSIEWIVEGCGEWHPPLAPATISTVEVWRGDVWASDILSPSPMGGYCLTGGTYRFTGTVGGGEVPAAVSEAAQRLSAYMAASIKSAGLTRERVTAGSVTVDKSRSASWAAQAMANSGAGDLLRNFRRV
ncbi:hypothetical protein HGP14_07905 [Rhizobium sp. P32RR-XVIII]|uniref:hypothetical protein n=1 Tax=Rhizobium sp. P32RR-XVIII TaxID=2726738 RepID=UPI0014571C53|nr:hypothetical protein [Rhizobium sp. P32RR-XVIII]NLS03294.1 hypothetical protein [Rhizobium sp. P32RR-XVIII]